VKHGDVQKQYRKIFVTGDDAEAREYQLPRGSHINVQEGERVKAGEPLMNGPIDPHDILRVRGEKELQRYLVDEIQQVGAVPGCAGPCAKATIDGIAAPARSSGSSSALWRDSDQISCARLPTPV
jgi:hypothetical protein